LTTPHGGAKIAGTADYFVIPAPVPCTVAVFTCPCGAQVVEADREQALPPGWSTTEDGSSRCPRCSAGTASEIP
jgi:hypothetical protein